MKFFKREKGQAGLNVLLSVVTMLFMLGMIIMVYVYAGSKLEESIDDDDADSIINETKTALGDVVDWFDIIIVMTALVVLILLIVLIINAIRGTGIVGGA